MTKGNRKLSSFLAVLSSLMMLAFVTQSGVTAQGASQGQAEAASAPVLKPMTPQMDPNADRKVAPLKAGIQHNEAADKPQPRKKPLNANASAGGFFGKMRGGARTADTDPLRARATTDGNGLSAGATSGYGIVGVKFVLTAGRPPIINRVFMGTPAQKMGLLPNDAIVAVDGVPTFGLTKEEVYDLIIGSPGTSVNISIQRNGDFRVVTCTRMDINELTDPLVRRDYLMSM